MTDTYIRTYAYRENTTRQRGKGKANFNFPSHTDISHLTRNDPTLNNCIIKSSQQITQRLVDAYRPGRCIPCLPIKATWESREPPKTTKNLSMTLSGAVDPDGEEVNFIFECVPYIYTKRKFWSMKKWFESFGLLYVCWCYAQFRNPMHWYNWLALMHVERKKQLEMWKKKTGRVL